MMAGLILLAVAILAISRGLVAAHEAANRDAGYWLDA